MNQSKINHSIIGNIITAILCFYSASFLKQNSICLDTNYQNSNLGILIGIVVLLSMFATWEKAKTLSSVVLDIEQSKKYFPTKITALYTLGSVCTIFINFLLLKYALDWIRGGTIGTANYTLQQNAWMVVPVLFLPFATLVQIIIESFMVANYRWEFITKIPKIVLDIILAIYKIVGLGFLWVYLLHAHPNFAQYFENEILELLRICFFFLCYIMVFFRFDLIEYQLEEKTNTKLCYWVSVILLIGSALFPVS